MAITEGMLLEVTVDGFVFASQVMNVWTYRVTGTFSGINAGQVANAYWQVVKGAYRAIASSGFNPAFTRVVVRDMSDPEGEYGSYSIPSNERAGSRDGAGSDALPAFVAGGIKLSVDTRVTRPGQKRIPWLLESDQNGGLLTSGAITLLDNIANAALTTVTLGAPALGMDLQAVVVKRDPVTNLPVASQDVTGWSIASYVTTQNSRKIGRGT